jgi:pimeloyl-ACP methyl ester carboxylesterase
MSKPIIHFSHANGFPAETYRKFFNFLQDDFDIRYINIHAHSPDYPVTQNWAKLTQELIDHIGKTYQEPVIGVGHSLGGVLILLAAIKQPKLFRSIVMLDSFLPDNLRSMMILLGKHFGFIDRITPAGRSKNRRSRWANFEEAVRYFQTKPLFQNFDRDCLRDYVEYGTRKTEHGIELRFDPTIEYRIFRTLPHNLRRYKRKLKVPSTFIYGEKSHLLKSVGLHGTKEFGIPCVATAGGHLFPFEYPQLSAARLREVITSMNLKQ